MEQTTQQTNQRRRGLAAMLPEKQKEIARKGGVWHTKMEWHTNGVPMKQERLEEKVDSQENRK